STPPTFILSQDQTLHNDVDPKLETSRSGARINPHLERLRKKTGRIKPAAREPFGPLPPACCRSCAGHPAAFAASGPRRPRRPGMAARTPASLKGSSQRDG